MKVYIVDLQYPYESVSKEFVYLIAESAEKKLKEMRETLDSKDRHCWEMREVETED